MAFADRKTQQQASARNAVLGRNQTSHRTEDDFVPSEFWVNVGYWDKNPDTGEDVFVALVKGIPLDDMRNERGRGWLAAAKNALRDELVAACEALQPGEASYVDCIDSAMSIQLRRADLSPVERSESSKGVIRLNFAKRD